MALTFCERWWLARRRPVGLMSAESAEARHNKRQPYCVLVGGSDRPACVVELAGVWVAVVFLDRCLRPYLRYDFRETAPERLFLKGIIHREFAGDSETETDTPPIRI